VAALQVDDLKAVFATVRSKDLIEARSRIPGTVASLRVDEGARVEAGQLLAIVADDKIALKIRSLDAQIQGIESRMRTAKTELDRSEELRKRGVSPQSRVDQAKTTFEVAANELKSAKAERAVLEEQIKEGQILAPAEGRVLKVPFTSGGVIAPGESVATIAAHEYLLRIELPERHARFTKVGDTVKVGGRGLGPKGGFVGEGRIVQVYPELKGGRVIADAEVAGLGDYFIGERAVVWMAAGQRTAYVVPRSFVTQKHGQDFVRVKRGPAISEVVVQLGRHAPLPGHDDGVEVLSGVAPADVLVRP
jgi:RND family efflux transporter MFP subunit